MRLSRIVITNFRNFKSLDVVLGEHAVILGENKVGKTNLIFALRLLLDPSMPESARRLRLDDFWDGLPRPLKPEDKIEIAVEFQGFDTSENLLAVLADHLVGTDPMVARISYRYQPIAGLKEAPRSESDYEFVIFGGDRIENTVGYELRRWMPLDLFPALRDAEADLARWSRSPLRPLLDRASKTIDAVKLAAIAKDVHATTSEITGLKELEKVVTDVNQQLVGMVGTKHSIETLLGFTPTDPDRLIRALQLMIDGGKRGVAEASLGSANVLYLALKQLEHQYLVEEGERQHTFLAIEEPEAHLHPHLQRLIYRNYLQTRDEAAAREEGRSILLTTHSPNVASVAPLSNIVVLRHVQAERHTIGRSLQSVALEKDELLDLERYIDVTRGDLFFSKAVILVEGDAEKFLVPTLAKLDKTPLDFDERGITVCAIGGTNFAPYVRLLGSQGLDIPFVVLTDFDPKDQAGTQEDADPADVGVGKNFGENRVVNQIMRALMTKKDFDPLTFEEVLTRAHETGVFLNKFTFEIDLLKAGTEKEFREAVHGLTDNKQMHKRFDTLEADPTTLDPAAFLKDVNSIGKGRLSQRLASLFSANKTTACPPCVKAAFKHLRERLA